MRSRSASHFPVKDALDSGLIGCQIENLQAGPGERLSTGMAPDPSNESMKTVPHYSSRPLPAYRFLPGRDPHPTADPRGHSVENSPWFEVQACAPEAWAECAPYLYGVDCFNHRYWWEAHEAWEPLWRGLDAASVQGRYIQGLIQAANALLKRRMGWRSATARLRVEAERHLQVVDMPWYMGLKVAEWRAALDRSLHQGGAPFPRLLLSDEDNDNA